MESLRIAALQISAANKQFEEQNQKLKQIEQENIFLRNQTAKQVEELSKTQNEAKIAQNELIFLKRTVDQLNAQINEKDGTINQLNQLNIINEQNQRNTINKYKQQIEQLQQQAKLLDNSARIQNVVKLLQNQDDLIHILTKTIEYVDFSTCSPKSSKIDEIKQEIQKIKQQLNINQTQNPVNYLEIITGQKSIDSVQNYRQCSYLEELSEVERDQVQELNLSLILIDLKEFQQGTGRKLLKSLKQYLPQMIEAEVQKDNNIMVTVKHEEADETIRIIKRLNVEGKRLSYQIKQQQEYDSIIW
ncbi:Hypothetical_protein [Hexamita inflata]|uniref:Hypothetical_protein n=1 Tax=Hexamita inflata TaxID=28002 RepID=A0AA86PBG3_9EUKA|nr:Hypothetical protein HINF_LOCUS23494 [Hexamita inflata]